MTINSINILTFGKLKNLKITLNGNLNVIYGDIENTEDTIIQFIKMVFYGAKPIDKDSDQLNNERLKYRPIDDFGSNMGGSIEFTQDEKHYRVERTFFDSNENDRVTLYNADNDTQIAIEEGQELGKIFFEMDEENFNRTLFIDEFNTDSNDEKSTQKLLNIISSYDENTSANVVQSRLTTAKETYLSKSGKIGILDKNKETLSSLHEDMETAQAEESQKIQMQIECEAVQYNIDEIAERYEELRRTLTIQQTMNEVNALKDTVAKLDKINDIRDEINIRKQALTNEKVSADENFIGELQKQMNAIQQVGEMKNQYQSNVYRVKTELDFMSESLKNSHVEEHRLYEEAVEQIEYTHGHIANISKSIQDKKLELEKLSEEIKEADINFRVIDEQVKAKKELDQQRLDMAQQQLTDAREPREPEVVSSQVSNKSIISIAVIICVLGILLTFTVNFWCVLVIGMGIVLALADFFDSNRQSKKIASKNERIDNIAIAKATNNLQNVRHAIEMEQSSLNKKLREAKKQLNMLKLSEEQINLDCEKHREQIQVLQKNLEYWEEQKQTTQKVFSTEQAKVDKKQNELDTLMENIATSEDRLYRLQNDILAYASQFSPCSTLTDVSNLLIYLTKETEQIRNLQNKADYQAEIIKSETNDQTYAELKERLTDITADYIEMCGRDNPLPMNPSELAKLHAEIDDCQFSLNMQNADLARIDSDIRSKFRNRSSVTEIEHNINHIEREILKQEKFCHSVDLANEVLQQSIDEVKQYNLTLNSITHDVFNQLTDGSYQSLAITKALDLANQYDNSINAWKYLANGTTEQSYFSLRFSVSKMVSNTYFGSKLPVIVNDSFIQYDNDNITKGIEFIQGCANDSQVIMFTSHKNIFDTIAKEHGSANLVPLA